MNDRLHAPQSEVKQLEVLAPAETTTLVRGSTVALSSLDGMFHPNALLGVFHRDERLLSSLTVLIDGQVPPLLSADRTGSSTDRVASLAALDQYRNGQALLVRRRTVSACTVSESLEVRTFSTPRVVELTIEVEADAASVLDLKSGGLPPVPLHWVAGSDEYEVVAIRDAAPFAVLRIDRGGAFSFNVERTAVQMMWKPQLEVSDAWEASWSISAPADINSAAISDARTIPARKPFAIPQLSVNADDYRWSPAIASAVADLEALVIDVPELDLRFIGAGAPWYQALFGRDSILAAWEALPLGTELALDVLETLSRFAGTKLHKRTQQAPGKIPHEWRIGRAQVFGMSEGQAYYGSVDASPLFVKLLAEAYRWGAPVERIRALLPAARAALHWCRTAGTVIDGNDRGPFLWYTPDPKGLGNQSWKDSGDCMLHADGSLAAGSLAVAEVQGYFFDALRSMARLERDLGVASSSGISDNNESENAVGPDADQAVITPEQLEDEARLLQAAFVKHFLIDGGVALAIDDSMQPLRVATSNMGHCLWTGIFDGLDRDASTVANRVMQPDLLAQWGIRTLGNTERAYNPLGYHLGTVWAHDSAVVAAGLSRHEFSVLANDLTGRLLDAAERFSWRLPELYGGLDTEHDRMPLPYPAACSPQAWSAGAPLLLLRAILGLEPDVPAGVVRVKPRLLDGQSLSVDGLRIGGQSCSLAVNGSNVTSCVGLGSLALH